MTLYLLIALLVGLTAWMVYNYWRISKAAKKLSNEEFSQKMHGGAQILDVRSPAAFQRKHIIGARNFPAQPLSQFKASLSALRKDKPILIYENVRGSLVANAALALKKAGYQDVYVLEYGLDYWDGKIKEG